MARTTTWHTWNGRSWKRGRRCTAACTRWASSINACYANATGTDLHVLSGAEHVAHRNRPPTRQPVATSTMRDPVVLENDSQKIFGVIHRPVGGPSTPRPAVAIFHGLV